MHVMYGYVDIYNITAATAKDFKIIFKKVFKDFYYILAQAYFINTEKNVNLQ